MSVRELSDISIQENEVGKNGKTSHESGRKSMVQSQNEGVRRLKDAEKRKESNDWCWLRSSHKATSA